MYLFNYVFYKVVIEGMVKVFGRIFDNINMVGKIGIIDDYCDSWFVGYDCNNLVMVWVGNDENYLIGLIGFIGVLLVFFVY